MNRSFLLAVNGLLLAGTVAGTTPAQILTAAQWREDLEFLAASLVTHHPNPFHAVSKESFQSRVDSLHERIPQLEDHEIVVELAGIVAMLQDGHTKIQGGFQFLTGQYPLRLYAFADGIFVRSAPSALRGTVGARLVRLGDTTAEEAYKRIASITSHDNEMTLKNRVPDSMTIPEILHALEILPHRDRARFVLIDQEERELILDLTPLPFEEKLNWIEVPDGQARPLYLRHLNANYWHQYMEEFRSLYVQYNRVRDTADEPIARYFARLSLLVEEIPLQCIVLDVRFNGGGNDYLNTPVVEWVKTSLPVVKGRFYVIIGRGTYSAAQKLITRLESTTDVILVGEPTGGSPNHFGDAATLELTHSGLTLKVSSLYHGDAPGDSRRAIEPDIGVSVSSEDYFSGRDPALEAILSAQPAGIPKR
jgi:hypothetical protein